MDTNASKVFDYFYQICAIPHGSRNTKAISDYCVEFARERGLEYVQDEFNNVIIKKPASPGFEHLPAVILQGHLDMVCAKDPDVEIDFLTQGIQTVIDGDWLKAKGTSLGADDGVAVAMTLAVLDDKTACHPALEAVFTVDEEIGLNGAIALDTSCLKGKYLLNMDSGKEGALTAGCAGGRRVNCIIELGFEKVRGYLYSVKIDGLLGGHSAGQINTGRANANKLLGKLLKELSDITDVRIYSLSGGFAENAIPTAATAEIVICEKDAALAEGAIESFRDTVKKAYKDADPDISVVFTRKSAAEYEAADRQSTRKAIRLICDTPNGVQRMNPDMPGMVQTSLNLGVLKMGGGTATASFAVRSNVTAEKEQLCVKLDEAVREIGGRTEANSDYPAWEYAKTSALRDMLIRCYKDVTGKDMEIKITHGGLECGILASKIPGLDCVAFGPDMHDNHCPLERLSISSTERTYGFLLESLKRFGKLCR